MRVITTLLFAHTFEESRGDERERILL